MDNTLFKELSAFGLHWCSQYVDIVTVLLFCCLVDIGQREMLGKRSVLFGREIFWLACCVTEGYVNPKGKF